jgi:hypothetical protein
MAKKTRARAVRLEDLEDVEGWRRQVLAAGGPAALVIADLILADAAAMLSPEPVPQTPVPEMASRAHVSDRTVRYKLDKLENEKLLQRDRGKGQGRGQANKLKPICTDEENSTEGDRGCIAPARAGPQRKSRASGRLRLHLVG